VPREAIEDVLGITLVHHEKPAEAKLRVSGLLDSHYAPRTPLYMGELRRLEGEAYRHLEQGKRVAILHRSPLSGGVCGLESHQMPDEPEAFARDLYATLRVFDEGRHFDFLLLETPPQTPAWLAVNDRVKRAAVGILT